MPPHRPRQVQVRPFPSNRRLVTAAMRAGRRTAPMHGLLDLDVTEANRLLAIHSPALSLTAFVVASVARAAAAHPGVHCYRNWRGQLVSHRHVDVSTIVEVVTAQGVFPLAHAIRGADIRDVVDLTAELRDVKPARRCVAADGGSPIPYLLPFEFPDSSRRCTRWRNGHRGSGSRPARWQ
jgi:pyruvate/2-oxoglutarate dehydrogenase complex dihydrolipoamide acyltransferase (E2) component